MTDQKEAVKLEERIVYAYGGKGGDVLKNEFKSEGSFMFRKKMEVRSFLISRATRVFI